MKFRLIFLNQNKFDCERRDGTKMNATADVVFVLAVALSQLVISHIIPGTS